MKDPTITGAVPASDRDLTGDERSMLARTKIPVREYLAAKRKVRAEWDRKGLTAATAGTGAAVTLSATDEKFLEQHPYISREKFLEGKRWAAIPAEHREAVREMELCFKAGVVLDDAERKIAYQVPGGLEAYCRGIEREKERERKATERKTRIETSTDLTPTDKEWLLRHTEQDLDAFLKAAEEDKRTYKPRSMVSSW